MEASSAGMGPLCDEAEFAELVRGLVLDTAPRLFALVEEVGEREDGWVYAWGMAFEDRVCLVKEGGGSFAVHPSAEIARRRWSRVRKLRLVWCGPEGEEKGGGEEDGA